MHFSRLYFDDAGMFQGTYLLTLDDKGRIALPAGQREQLSAFCGGAITVTKNPLDAGCLWIYPRPEWQRVREQLMTLNSFEDAHRNLQRQLLGSSVDLEPDSSGRVQLPLSLRELAGLEKRCVLVGLGMKYELWNEELYRALSAPLNASILTSEIRNLRI